MDRILFVDDEALILNSLKRGLMDEPYEKFFATSGEDALKILKTQNISVLVTDMKMPGMSGLDLLKAVKEPYPDLIKLVLSGYTQLPQVLVTVNQGDIFKFITKPWDLEEELKGILREAIDYYNYRVEVKKGREALEKKNITFQNILKTYDDKILSMRDEMLLMRDMNENLSQEILRKINRWNPKTDNKSVLTEEIEEAQALLGDAFALMPVQMKRFNSKFLLDDMRKYVADSQLLTRVEFGMNSSMKTSMKGRYELLLFMFKKMLTLLIVEDFDAQVGLVISGSDISETHFLFTALMETDDRWFRKGAGAEAAFKWLSLWIAGFEGELQMKEMGQRKAVVLSMTCEC